LLEYGEKFIGLIAIDSSAGASKAKSNHAKGPSSVALIRHFYVEEKYRPSDIQSDLLDHAVKHAFGSRNKIKSIRATDSPLSPYTRQCLRKAGFKMEPEKQKMGALRWEVGTSVLSRGQWEKTQESIEEKKEDDKGEETDD